MEIIKIPSVVKAGSANYDPRETIIHAHGEYLWYEDKWFHFIEFQDHIGLSAHYWITPLGNIIERVPPTEKAWHAKGVNSSSIGIEFIVPGFIKQYSDFTEKIKTDWLSDQQLKSGVALVQHLGLPIRRHSDQAPGRKVDPGSGFPWGKFKQLTAC